MEPWRERFMRFPDRGAPISFPYLRLGKRPSPLRPQFLLHYVLSPALPEHATPFTLDDLPLPASLSATTHHACIA